MQLLFPQGSITGIGQHQVYHTLWHVYQYRSCWVLGHPQGQSVVLFLPGEAGQALRFMTAGDVRDGGATSPSHAAPCRKACCNPFPRTRFLWGLHPGPYSRSGIPSTRRAWWIASSTARTRAASPGRNAGRIR